MPVASAATIAPARRVQGRLRVPGRQVDLPPLRAARRAGRGPLARCRTTRRAPTAGRRSPACEALGRRDPSDADGDVVTVLGRGFGRLAFTGRAARRRQLGHDDAAAGRGSGGPALSQPRSSATPRCRGRPMRRVIEPLSGWARGSRRPTATPPLTIHGAPPARPSPTSPTVPSAQVKSAVLLAGLHADGTTRSPSRRRRAITPSGRSRRSASTSTVDGLHGLGRRAASALTAETLAVPGDFSSAAFWMVAAAALPGSRVEIEDVGLNPTRTGLLDVLRRFGARVDVDETATRRRRAARAPIVVEGDRTGSVEIAPDGSARPDRRAAGHRRARRRTAARSRCAAPPSCGSRRATASRRSWPASARSASTPTSGRTASSCAASGSAGGRRRRCPRRPPDGDGVRDRGARRRAARRAIDGADVVAISYPGFFETLARWRSVGVKS